MAAQCAGLRAAEITEGIYDLSPQNCSWCCLTVTESPLPPRGRPSIHSNLVYPILPRVEEQDVIDSLKGLFCFPPPFALDSDKEGYFIRLRLNFSSLRSDAQEARQNIRLFKEACGVVNQAWND